MAVNRVPFSPTFQRYAPLTEKYSSKKTIDFKYIWIIDNFSFRGEETCEFIQSPQFSSGASADSKKWCLRLYPKGKDKQSQQYVSLNVRLIPESRNTATVIGKFKLSILNAKQKPIHTQDPKDGINFKQILGLNFSFPHFVRRDFLEDDRNYLLPDDKLTIICEGSIVSDSFDTAGEKNITQSEGPECKFFEDFWNLFVDEKFSDVTLVAGGRKIQAHKAVLAARSDVFATMFEHNMEERTLNRVEITDVEYEVLKEMLSFIYVEWTPRLKKLAKDVLPAADKYALVTLKVMCEKVLSETLSIDTAAETLILAHLHSSDQLKEQTMEYIKTHIADIVTTNGWKNVISCNKYSSLLAEIIQILATAPPISMSQIFERSYLH